MTALRASIRLNNDVDARTYAALTEAADDAGFDQVWVSHDLTLRAAPVMVAAAAHRTRGIHLGVGIMNPYSIHPSELAMTAATLQEVTDGRFLMGLGAGAERFLAWAGLRRDEPLARTAEAVRAVRTLLAGGRPVDVGGTGAGWTGEAHLRIAPLPDPPPLYLGVMGPRMLRLAAAEGDGALPLLLPPEHWATVRREVAAGLAAAGRAPEGLDLAACVWVAVDDDADRARRLLAGKLAYYGPSLAPSSLALVGVVPEDFRPAAAALAAGDPEAAVALVTDDMLRVGIAGGTADVAARAGALIDAGARHVSFGPPLGPDPVAAVTLLGRRVLPELRARAAAVSGGADPA